MLGLIKFRQRSEKEIRDKLALKGYSPEILEELIRYFKGAGYINDREFARAWITSRLRKPLGFRLIRQELRQKGVSEEIIDEVSREKRQSIDEYGIIEGLAGKYYQRLKEKKELPQKIKPKLYAYLTRRGFSSDSAGEVIRKIILD